MEEHLDELLDFWTFHDELSKQMLTYDPLKRGYKGGAEMRVCTAQTKKGCVKVVGQIEEEDISPNRPRKRGRPNIEDAKARALEKDFINAKAGRGVHSRLCGNLTQLKKPSNYHCD